MVITIRPALPADVPLIFEMLRESAVEQGSPQSLAVTEATLLEDGFGPAPLFHCIVAEMDHSPAGMALYFFNYSTWISRVGLYLEDIFVDRRYRRAGVARALLTHLRTLAREKGYGRMQWLVHRDNRSAIALYRSFGAQMLDQWILMTLRDEAA